MPDASTAPASTPAAEVKPPSADSVLYFISNVDGDGALSYETVNGSWINYWLGFPFEVGGTRYFTGFAWQTPDKYTPEQKQAPAAPETKVTLSDATFVLGDANSKTPWKLQGSEPSIGEFGGFERADELDPKRKLQTWMTPSGDMLLAVPTWYLVSGSTMRTIQILLFNPHELDGTNDKRWRYLATLEAGTSNDGSCGPDEPGNIPCVDTTGTLSFANVEGSDLPVLTVSLTGTGATPGDSTTEYRYDPAHTTYRSTPR